MRRRLWTYMHEEHWVSLLESELNDIETIVYADLRKLVVKWETPYEHFDEDYDIPNRFTCADDVKQLLDGGE